MPSGYLVNNLRLVQEGVVKSMGFTTDHWLYSILQCPLSISSVISDSGLAIRNNMPSSREDNLNSSNPVGILACLPQLWIIILVHIPTDLHKYICTAWKPLIVLHYAGGSLPIHPCHYDYHDIFMTRESFRKCLLENIGQKPTQNSLSSIKLYSKVHLVQMTGKISRHEWVN